MQSITRQHVRVRVNLVQSDLHCGNDSTASVGPSKGHDEGNVERAGSVQSWIRGAALLVNADVDRRVDVLVRSVTITAIIIC